MRQQHTILAAIFLLLMSIVFSPATLQGKNRKSVSATKSGTAGKIVHSRTRGLMKTSSINGEYSFSATTGAFHSIAGIGDSVSAGPLDADDELYKNIPIGFSFTFDDAAYTEVAACSNGWVSFSAPMDGSTNGYNVPNDLSYGYGIEPFIAPLFGDLLVNGNIYYKTLNSAPNRKFVVEWNNIAADYEYEGSNSLSFQLILDEATGSIQFVYSPGPDAATTFDNPGGSGLCAGIVDASLDYVSVNSLSISAIASETEEYDYLYSPPSEGLTFTFTPAGSAPRGITGAATNVRTTTATLNGLVRTDGSSVTARFLYGTTPGVYTDSVAATPSTVTVDNTPVSASLTPLTSDNTRYYYCIATICGGNYRQSSAGSFTTQFRGITEDATAIGATTATLNGLVQTDGSSVAVKFLYGTTSGVYTDSLAATPSTVTVDSTLVSASIDHLVADSTTYYYCIATISGGDYRRGSILSFETLIHKPTVQASSLTATPGRHSVALHWTNGDGVGRIVLATEGSSITDAPADQATYVADTSFGFGDQVGNSYVVYTGTGSSVTINGLKANTAYTFAEFENSAHNSVPYYLTTSRPAATTTTLASLPPQSIKGSALRFDGVDDYVRVTPAVWFPGTDFTVEAWVYVYASMGTYNPVFGFGNGKWSSEVRMSIEDNGELVFTMSSGGDSRSVFSNDGDVHFNQWVHVAVAQTGTVPVLYVNGVEVARWDFGYGAPNVMRSINFIGKDPWDEMSSISIDEFRIWNVARSAAEILKDKDTVFSSIPSGLVGYWQFNESSGGYAFDVASGTAGTLQQFNYTSVSGWVSSDIPTAGLPVELAGFTANVRGGKTMLTWNTATETNNAGFEIERRSDGSWGKIGFIKGSGTSNAPHSYTYTDNSVSTGTYTYRLKQIDNNGASKYSGEVIATIAAPKSFALHQNYPNPFNPATTISYDVPQQSFVTMTVFDIMGREAAVLVNEMEEPGIHDVQFNASAMASGVYFYKLTARPTTGGQGNFSAVKRLVLLR